MSNKSSEKSEMSELMWASERLQRDIAPHGSVKERVRDAARTLGWKHSRARTIWYADERASIKPKELRRIEEITGVEYGRSDRAEVDRLIAKADALLMGNDPDFHGPFVAAVRAFFGALDRTGTRGDGQ
jgi:hypothetical protein